MQKFQHLVTDTLGIHARPAGMLVKMSTEIQSTLSMTKEGCSRVADLKKIFAVMSLGVKSGETVSVTVTGADEEAAVIKLKNFFQDNL
ncbi:MAG TPA: HPr family phosphocarrier protein [Negativicutes bacterium]|nr:HPr family phosphocarrier protein [Negativicutes bacterium]